MVAAEGKRLIDLLPFPVLRNTTSHATIHRSHDNINEFLCGDDE